MLQDLEKYQVDKILEELNFIQFYISNCDVGADHFEAQVTQMQERYTKYEDKFFSLINDFKRKALLAMKNE